MVKESLFILSFLSKSIKKKNKKKTLILMDV